MRASLESIIANLTGVRDDSRQETYSTPELSDDHLTRAWKLAIKSNGGTRERVPNRVYEHHSGHRSRQLQKRRLRPRPVRPRPGGGRNRLHHLRDNPGRAAITGAEAAVKGECGTGLRAEILKNLSFRMPIENARRIMQDSGFKCHGERPGYLHCVAAYGTHHLF